MIRLAIFREKVSKGFTLIELLIVIAVLGVLAAVILVAIDPVEQLARGRDAGRKSAVTSVGRAMQAYYTNNSVYPTTAEWTGSNATNVLVLSGDIKIIPTQTTNPIPLTVCTGGSLVSNFCYKVNAAIGAENMVVYTRVESRSEREKGPCTVTAGDAWLVYASIDGRAGIVCLPAGTEPNATTSYTYY